VAHDRAPESVLAFVVLVPDALELVEVVLDQAIPRRGLDISRPLDSLGQALHIDSNCPVAQAAKKMSSGTRRCMRGDFLVGKGGTGVGGKPGQSHEPDSHSDHSRKVRLCAGV
jgi:hypothetical protein